MLSGYEIPEKYLQGSEEATGNMSLRDYFAGQALAASNAVAWERYEDDPDFNLAEPDGDVGWQFGPSLVAERAYLIADAMLKERVK